MRPILIPSRMPILKSDRPMVRPIEQMRKLVLIDAAKCHGIADEKAHAKAHAARQRNSVEKLMIMWR